MFGRKPPSDDTPPANGSAAPAPFQSAASRAASPAPARPASVPSNPQPSTSALASPLGVRRPAEPSRAEATRDARKLIVGPDITLSGEIAACDHLIVQGAVDASVKDCHRLEVAENGLFRGKVEISEAEIAGRFEGEIVVQGRLSIRSTGQVQGKVQYGELAVEAGGRLDGTVHGKGGSRSSKPAVTAPAPVEPAPTTGSLGLAPVPSEEPAA